MAPAHDASASRGRKALVTIHTPVSISIYSQTAQPALDGPRGRSPSPSSGHSDGMPGRSTSADGHQPHDSDSSADHDSGYNTDDTMPSLEYVEDSSDDEYY